MLQLAGFAFIGSTPVMAEGSETPNGPIKSLIITYDSLPGEPRTSVGVAQTRAKYFWQKNRVMTELSYTKGYKRVLRNLSEMPVSVVQVDAEGEASLRANKRIKSITEDKLLDIGAGTDQALPVMGGTVANGFSDGTTNFTGNGQTVAIIDSGFNLNHIMLSGAVVSEACYSQSGSYTDAEVISTCAGGADSSTSTGSSAASDCSVGVDDGTCAHGTAVASAAAGRQVTGGGKSYSGSAKAAKLVLIKATLKVQEKAGQADFCGDPGTVSFCYKVNMSGVLTGLNRVAQLQNDAALNEPISSVNVSIGQPDNTYSDTSTCDADSQSGPYLTAFAALREANIAPVMIAHNNGNTDTGNGQTVHVANANKIAWPACLTNAVAVSASAVDDTPAYYTEAGPRTDIFAPGGDLLNTNDGGLPLADVSSNNGLVDEQGTSFAGPIVAGAWAVAREKNPSATVATILRIMQETAVTITDNRPSYTTTSQKRLALAATLSAMNNKPAITTAAAAGGTHTEGDTVPITVTSTNATTCAIGSNSATVSGGSATINVTATSGQQNYKVVCSNVGGYAAQYRVGFVAGAATTQFPSNPSAGNDGQVLLSRNLGVPNTGFGGLIRSNPIVTLTVTLFTTALIVIIAKRYSSTTASR